MYLYPYVGGGAYRCSCPGCPCRTDYTTTTTTATLYDVLYVPKHRKPGPAR